MAKVRTERTSKPKSNSGKWWSPPPLAFKTEKDELIEATSGNLTLTDTMFYTDARSAVHDCWKRRTLPALRGGLTIQARTTLPQAAIPPAVLSVVMSAFESGLQEVFAGAEQAEREVKTDFGDVAWSLRFAPNVVEEPDASDHSTVAHRPESGQTASPGNKVAEGPGRDASRTLVADDWEALSDRVKEALAKVLASRSAAAETQLSTIKTAKHQITSNLAQMLERPLQEIIDDMPAGSRQEKQAICTFVNATLREIGMAVRCPKTGRPAILVADSKEAGSDISRFRYAVRDEKGRKVRTVTTSSLPKLELMEDELRAEPLLTWAARVKEREKNSEREIPGS